MQQKDIFLQSEADAWYRRNQAALAQRDFSSEDPVVSAILEIAATRSAGDAPLRILEVGCGEGRRLAWLAQHLGAEVYGVEPSSLAVEQARSRGVDAARGTADALPYEDGRFDILIYGFCLYLCDRQDLFRIAQEADRVLKPDAWLVINDFHAQAPVRREYHHRPGVYSYKMDYRKLFDWHPAYACHAHRVSHHATQAYTDEPDQWVALSVLRKRAGSDA